MARSLTKNSPRARRRRNHRGIALLLVLWALFLLVLLVLALVRQVNQHIVLDTHDARRAEARALAFSGLQIALHPGVRNNLTTALRGQPDAMHRWETTLRGEGGKLNLNWIVAGEDARKLDILRSFLEARGLTYSERATFVDCLLDWIDADNIARLNGSEVDVNGQPVPNRPLQDLSELRRMKGAAPLLAQKDWENAFTLLSRGPVDLQWADEELLAVLPNIGQARARAFVQARRGPDGIDGTADDLPINSLDEARALLGLTPEQFQAIGDLLVLRDPTMRIVSTGRAGDVARHIEVVAVKEAATPQIARWREY
ncbi:MAG: general secretion pathway protein GspK [Verrucomicrobia bacterium]|nr:general secretion pathway protein GspK [Verrucomicrobiota bacterium]